ncbi:MAG: hypothetical protein IJ454_03045 [Clostridia bacterium]|nr:hypothetical protein [Clostridia bacterium]
MQKHKLLSIILAFILVFTLSVPTAHASLSITVTTLTVDMSGVGKIIGYIQGAPEDTEVSLFITYGSDIVYIDQITAGNNGSFLFKIKINAKYSEKDININIGSNSGASPYTSVYKLPYMPPGFEHIDNNSVIYGHDAYTANSIYLADSLTVTDSIIHGGNIIYFKIGDRWYDLMNPKATSSAFFVAENATPNATVKANTAPLRYYYYGGKIVDFAKE